MTDLRVPGTHHMGPDALFIRHRLCAGPYTSLDAATPANSRLGKAKSGNPGYCCRDGESQRPGGSKLARAAVFVARARMAISRSGYAQTGCSAPERQQNFWSNGHATLDSAPALSTGPTASTDALISGESVLTPPPAGHMQSPRHSCCGIGVALRVSCRWLFWTDAKDLAAGRDRG